MPKKVLSGVVVQDALDKTIAVEVVRSTQHKKYFKRIKLRKKYQVHDPENRFKIGNSVKIIESRPISKLKKWHVLYDLNSIPAV